MAQTRDIINEKGEISREDYFFSAVKGNYPQALPTNRKVWKVWLLSLVTLGIYSIVIMFAMAKETNISCADDGKHTRNFWGAILLSIITLGIYGLVWFYKWADREFRFLQRHSPNGGILSGGGLLALMLVSMILSLGSQYASSQAMYYGPSILVMLLSIIQLIWNIFVISKYLDQHNTVNRIYNLKNFCQK